MFRRVIQLLRMLMGGEHVPETREQEITQGVCPVCKAKDLHAGPKGGASTNFACFNCHTRYNAAFIPNVGILFLEKTGSIGQQEKQYFRKTPLQEDGEYIFG